MFKPASKLRTHEKPYNTKAFSKLILDKCKNAPINTDASPNSPYHSNSEAIERHNTPINMKLQSDSPYHPAKNKQETCSREQKHSSN